MHNFLGYKGSTAKSYTYSYQTQPPCPTYQPYHPQEETPPSSPTNDSNDTTNDNAPLQQEPDMQFSNTQPQHDESELEPLTPPSTSPPPPTASDDDVNTAPTKHESPKPLTPTAAFPPLHPPPSPLLDTSSSTLSNRGKKSTALSQRRKNKHRKRRREKRDYVCCPTNTEETSYARGFLRGTLQFMNFLAKILLWGSILAMAAGVIWYTRELIINGTDPHLIAWFSAGAFVILGFPISIYGIFMHLSNYYEPNIQCYVVRILWMVPVYSIESWLCLRFHEFAIYIETLRDCYESYVLYCFLQFLIQALGGEEELTLILKDKSPTRGVHFTPLNWCFRPWIMGQPLMRVSPTERRIMWTSPFFVKCKFGVLQYVLLKFLCAVMTMILELHGLYKEGDFSPSGGYLYICIITNTSQCWALYCLAFFYYATKNELSPIRPVGKFLAVKALVFFTWWQSLFISILFQLGLIPSYDESSQWSAEDVAKGLQDYLICIEMFLAAILHTFVFPHTDYLHGSRMARAPRSGVGIGRQRHMRLGRNNKFKKRSGGDDRSSGSAPLTDGESVTEMPSDAWKGSEVEMTTFQNEVPQQQEDDCSAGSFFSTGDEFEEEEAYNEARKVKPGFVSAFLDSTVPRDVIDNSVGIVKGEFRVEKKTLLHHAATKDEYELFSKRRRVQRLTPLKRVKESGGGKLKGDLETGGTIL